MRRVLCCVLGVLLLGGCAPAVAGAHAAFLGSDPAPGIRLAQSPQRVSLSFTEPLDGRLSTASVVSAGDRRRVAGVSSAVDGERLVLRLAPGLARGAYRVRWHTVSTRDGHALEGSFSFGVRAPAVGGEHDVQQSPLARAGWLRILSRVLMYGALLCFTGALGLQLLLGRRGRSSWLVPNGEDGDLDGVELAGVERRARRLVIDAGLVAVAAAALSAVADGVDAAGGLSARRISEFLLYGQPGQTRLVVIGVLALSVVAAGLRLRAAALGAAIALLGVALSGHANASSPRAVAVVNDWLHLLGGSLWLGGIVVVVAVWSPALRGMTTAQRVGLARLVLARFGRVALPAFVVVVITGAVSALIEVGSLANLGTGYGRALLVKVDIVAAIAAVSYTHARRLRPRMLAANAHPDAGAQRRHWRLVRAEPVLGAGVICAVALLVAFPLPPRQLSEAAQARAATPQAACDPCPLPAPAPGELAVAAQGGSNVVAAWIRRPPGVLAGTVRVYGLRGKPSTDAFFVLGARQNACGPGCARFTAPAASTVRVRVRQDGHGYLATLPTTWRPDGAARARRLLNLAQRTMRALRSVREVERGASVPGLSATTRYRLKAPDRMAFVTDGGVSNVVIADRQWLRGQPGAPIEQGQFGEGIAFALRSWFTWSTYARHVFLLGERSEHGRAVSVIGLMDPGTPTWWQLTIDRKTKRVLHDQVITYGHFDTERYSAFNAPLEISPPPSAPTAPGG